MNFNPKISVIIPTYNRSGYLIKIINKLITSKIPNEIIICDSGSKDNTKEKIKKIQSNYKNHSIKYVNIKENISSIKRNIGIRLAKSKYIVFLDDDCIPESKFLENYYRILEKYKYKKYLFCGTVYYPNTQTNKNFIRYRQSRHFKIKKIKQIGNFSLHPRNIVTMNMAIRKKILLDNWVFFNEKFNRYGFEDYEFAYRLSKKNVEIIPCSPIVFHHDLRNFKQYLNKIKFTGYEGSKYLIKINKRSSMENNFVKIENYPLTKLMAKSVLILRLLTFVEKIFVYLEKKINLPNFIYRALNLNAYLIGHFSSKNNKKKDNNFLGWYK